MMSSRVRKIQNMLMVESDICYYSIDDKICMILLVVMVAPVTAEEPH